jgi:hypothetical protein
MWTVLGNDPDHIVAFHVGAVGVSSAGSLMYYVLDEAGEPVPEPDVLRWSQWFEAAGELRRVAQTQIGNARVSTVFLGIDHGWAAWGGRQEVVPLLFETMIFGGLHDQWQWRHHTRTEARIKHDQICGALSVGHAPRIDP